MALEVWLSNHHLSPITIQHFCFHGNVLPIMAGILLLRYYAHHQNDYRPQQRYADKHVETLKSRPLPPSAAFFMPRRIKATQRLLPWNRPNEELVTSYAALH